MIPSNPLLIPSLVAADKATVCSRWAWPPLPGSRWGFREGSHSSERVGRAVNPAGQNGPAGHCLQHPHPTPARRGSEGKGETGRPLPRAGSWVSSLAESWPCYSMDPPLLDWGASKTPILPRALGWCLPITHTRAHTHTYTLLPINVSSHPATLRKSLCSLHSSSLPPPSPCSITAPHQPSFPSVTPWCHSHQGGDWLCSCPHSPVTSVPPPWPSEWSSWSQTPCPSQERWVSAFPPDTRWAESPPAPWNFHPISHLLQQKTPGVIVHPDWGQSQINPAIKDGMHYSTATFPGPAAPGPFEQNFVILSCGPKRDLFSGSSSEFFYDLFWSSPPRKPVAEYWIFSN